MPRIKDFPNSITSTDLLARLQEWYLAFDDNVDSKASKMTAEELLNFIKSQSDLNLPLDGSKPMDGDFNLGGNSLLNVSNFRIQSFSTLTQIGLGDNDLVNGNRQATFQIIHNAMPQFSVLQLAVDGGVTPNLQSCLPVSGSSSFEMARYVNKSLLLSANDTLVIRYEANLNNQGADWYDWEQVPLLDASGNISANNISHKGMVNACISTTGGVSISRQNGDFPLVGVATPVSGLIVIDHNLGHTNYYVMATAVENIASSKGFVTLSSVTNNNIQLRTFDINGITTNTLDFDLRIITY
jgi:hypothetical protein